MRLTSGTVVIVLGLLRSVVSAQPSAEDLYNQGQAAFDRGDYATAVARWSSAYELSHLPLLVFNLGQAHRLSGDCSKALAAYQQYIVLDARAEQRTLADGFIAELSAQCTTKRVEEPRADPNPTKGNDTHRASRQKIAGLVIVGAGVVSLTTGIYFGHRASSLGDEVTDTCKSGCDWALYGGKDAEGRGAETKQYVFYGLGTAAIIGGGVMYLLTAREAAPTPIAITSGRKEASITWNGTW